MKVCFVGTGSIGKRHILNLTDLCNRRQIQLTIHVLRSQRKKLEAEIEIAIEKQFFALEDIEKKYDAIFICNPTFMHYSTIKEMRNHAECFFVEKPVFNHSLYRLSELELPKHNRYYVACPLRYANVLLYAEEILKEKRVISVQAISSSYLPEWRKEVDYRSTYSAKIDEGGGVRIDLIHEWDYLVKLFGRPESVLAFSGKYSKLEITSEDICIYIARYADKLLELHLDYFGKNSKRYLQVWTEDEEYFFDIINQRVLRNGEICKEFQEDRNDMYLREMEHFLEIMAGKCDSSNTLEHAVEILKIAESDNGRIV